MNCREASKNKNWPSDEPPTIQQINLGSFQRIADACELMAQRLLGEEKKEMAENGLHGKHCDHWIMPEGRYCDKPATVCQGRRYRCSEHDPYALSKPEPVEEKTFEQWWDNTPEIGGWKTNSIAFHLCRAAWSAAKGGRYAR